MAVAASQTSPIGLFQSGTLSPANNAAAGDGEDMESDRTILASPTSRRRRAASRSRQRRSSRVTSSGTSSGTLTQLTSFESTAASTCDTVSPSKARVLVSISNRTAPNAQMSLRLSTGLPLACSGDM